jgi:hypothetical protein
MNTQTTTQLKSIKGYNDKYFISNKGIVYSKRSKINTKNVRIHILTQLKPRENNTYLYVGLSKHGKFKNERINRLVALAFIPNVENKTQVDHINGNKHDNRVENLRWVTPSENKMNTKQNKYTNSFKDQVINMASKMSLMQLHKKFNIPLRTIQTWVKRATEL